MSDDEWYALRELDDDDGDDAHRTRIIHRLFQFHEIELSIDIISQRVISWKIVSTMFLYVEMAYDHRREHKQLSRLN